jgi:hypothetical protein
MERNAFPLRGFAVVNFKDLIRECEADIRAGMADQAALRLRELPTAKIPDDLRFTFANLCRRTGLVSIGLKVLTPPHLRDRAEWLLSVGPAEKAEYALLLQRIGSVNEAMRILDRVDAAAFPDALLYRAYCHFNRWEYAEAIPLLEKYVGGPLDEYKLLIGRVNLVAALVSTGARSASAELAALLKACESGGHVRLAANCHELRAQLALAATDLAAAKDAIAAALGILSPAKTLDQLFARKLQAVMTAVENGRAEAMEEFRREALDRMDWESARDIDFYMLKLNFSYERFEHLIFGTPFAAYRERVCQALGRRILKDSYVFGDAGGPVMDVAKAEIDGLPCLTVGGKIHQMLGILLRDFYRPKTLAALFSELFPSDHFDIFSSPDRVHQILRRTRAWLAEAGIPAEIVEIDRYYQIQVTGKFGFRLNLDRAPLDWNLVHFRRLKCIASADRLYTPKELRQKLGLGLTPFRRFATWAMEEGKLERSGTGSTTVYRLTGGSY